MTSNKREIDSFFFAFYGHAGGTINIFHAHVSVNMNELR